MSGFFYAQNSPQTKPSKIYLQAMSISKAQAEALADGFLEGIGTEEKSALQPRETFYELFLLGGELIEDAQNNLNTANINSSGGLSSSIILSEPRRNGTAVQADILMAEHGQYINKGVKGTRSGYGLYQFKTENPSPKMLANLIRSKIKAKRSTTNVNAAKSTSKNELKNAANAKLSKAWGAAVNIKRHGIKKTGFLDKAIEKTEKKVEERLGAALKIDIENSI